MGGKTRSRVASSTNARGSAALNRISSKNTTPASVLRASRSNVTSVLLMSPTIAVPHASDSSIARSIASRISGAFGSG